MFDRLQDALEPFITEEMAMIKNKFCETCEQHPILFLNTLLPHRASGHCASDPISTVAQNSLVLEADENRELKKPAFSPCLVPEVFVPFIFSIGISNFSLKFNQSALR